MTETGAIEGTEWKWIWKRLKVSFTPWALIVRSCWVPYKSRGRRNKIVTTFKGPPFLCSPHFSLPHASFQSNVIQKYFDDDDKTRIGVEGEWGVGDHETIDKCPPNGGLKWTLQSHHNTIHYKQTLSKLYLGQVAATATYTFLEFWSGLKLSENLWKVKELFL